MPTFNYDKLAEAEKYDGYYAIVSSELEMSDNEVINTYRGLWEIEETFKITKSELKARPVYVRIDEHIDAHFLTCFIALVIIRIIHKKTNREYSTAALIDCLRQISCSLEYVNEISDAIGEAFGIDFTRKRLKLGEIKKILGGTKK